MICELLPIAVTYHSSSRRIEIRLTTSNGTHVANGETLADALSRLAASLEIATNYYLEPTLGYEKHWEKLVTEGHCL